MVRFKAFDFFDAVLQDAGAGARPGRAAEGNPSRPQLTLVGRHLREFSQVLREFSQVLIVCLSKRINVKFQPEIFLVDHIAGITTKDKADDFVPPAARVAAWCARSVQDRAPGCYIRDSMRR